MSSFAAPQPNDPLAGNAQYQGQLADFSQYVQLDDQGCTLFFIVDGSIYDGKGYRIAEGLDLPSCSACVQPGTSEVVVAKVPNDCARWYILHTQTISGTAAKPILNVSVLDMTAQNPAFPADPERRGLLIEYGDLTLAGFSLTDDFDYSNEVSVDLNDNGQLPDQGWGAVSRCIHMDAVHSPATGRTFLFVSTGYHLARYEILSNTLVHLGTTAIPHQGLNPSSTPPHAKSELEAVAVNDEIRVALSYGVRNEFSLPPPPPDYLELWMHLASFDALDPGLSVLNTDDVSLGTLLFTDPAPPNGSGGAVNKPMIGGVEFSPNGRYVYWSRSYGDYGQQSWDGNLHFGYIDLDNNNSSFSLPVQTPLPFVDSELEVANAPSGNGMALYACGTDGLGNAWLAALLNPDAPDPANWVQQAWVLGDAGLCMDQTITVNGVPDKYHLLQSQEANDPSSALLSNITCCTERLEMTCTVRYQATAGSSSWSPTNNPFCDKPIARICEELRIPAGSHVDAVDLRIEFGSSATLVIEPGASFTCTNCTLTTACPSTQWRGIEVQGNFFQHQYGTLHPDHQGELVLTGSLVENAEVGALACGRNSGGGIDGFMSGGVVRCTNTTFKNCRTGVQFTPYQGFVPGTTTAVRNKSRFVGATFTLDNDYPVALDFKHHAYLWQVDGIPFTGCTFENLRAETNSHERGYGIYSLDAHYEVRERCNVLVPLGQECPAGSYSPSTFTGLDHGIHALTSLTSRAFVVDRAAFTANVCGVYASGVVGYRVTRSDFELGNSVVTDLTNFPIEENWFNRHRGLYSYRSHGFIAEDNSLVQAGNHAETEGIVIGYSGAHNDVVRRNTATGLERAFIGEGICAETSGGQSDFLGLQLLCNTNLGNQVNLWDRKVTTADQPEQLIHSIRTFQGHPPLLNGVPTRPGANVFDQSCGVDEWDYERTSTYALLNYFYGQTATDEPLCYTLGYVAKQQLPPAPGDPCPARNYRPRGVRSFTEAQEVKSDLQAEKLAYGNTRYLYDQLLDGGSTDEVVLEIMGTWPQDAWQLRDHLLALSPFVSTTALKEMVMRNVMPAAMVTEVLVANPDATKQEGFVPWMQEESGHPLPAYLLNMVYASWDELNYRSTLLGTMAYSHAAMTQHAHALVDDFRNDTIHDPTDSLLWTWQQVRTPAARYSEALTHLQKGHFAAAFTVVNNIPVEHELRDAEVIERQRMLDLIAFVQQVGGSGRTMAQLTVPEVDALEMLVDGAHDRPAVWAQNLLCFAYERCAAPLTGGEPGPRAPQAAYDPVEEESVNTLSAHPNPSNAWVALDYTIGSAENAWLVVTDLTGRQVARVRLAQLQGQHLIDARHLEAGAYNVQLLLRGEQVATEKLIIQ